MSDQRKKEGLLLCEWGEQFCCAAWFSRSDKTLHNLEYFSFPDLKTSSLDSIFKEILHNNVEEAVICSAFPQAILMPPRVFDINRPLLPSVYPESHGRLLNDMIAEWQIINQYSMPQVVFNHVFNAATTTRFFHTYSCTLKACNNSVSPDSVLVHFDPKQFRVMVMKGGKPLLAQTYNYTAPLDVVYYLLKIFEQLHLNQNEVQVIVSGLIEKDSALYKELYNYFLHLQMQQGNQITLENNNHPEHFFTSMYNLAACVL